MGCGSKDEAERDYGSNQIAGNHDPPAVETIQQHPGKRPYRNGGNSARQQNAGDNDAGMRKRHSQHKDSNIVEITADFADNLARPCVAIIAILAEQLEELVHQPAEIGDLWNERVESSYLTLSKRIRAMKLRGVCNNGDRVCARQLRATEPDASNYVKFCRIASADGFFELILTLTRKLTVCAMLHLDEAMIILVRRRTAQAKVGVSSCSV